MEVKIKKLNTLTSDQFACLIGIDKGDVPEECIEMLSEENFDYEILQGRQRDALMLEVVRKIDSGKMNIAGKEKQQVWEAGWLENIENTKSSFRRTIFRWLVIRCMETNVVFFRK